jgi:hypothetical protein
MTANGCDWIHHFFQMAEERPGMKRIATEMNDAPAAL